MAVEGVYQVKMETPLGNLKGTMTLIVNGVDLTGSIKSSAGTFIISDGKVEGDNATWKMVTKVGIVPVKYKCRLTVNGDNVSGVAESMMGSAKLEGTRGERVVAPRS
jgi:hypothetical protein